MQPRQATNENGDGLNALSALATNDDKIPQPMKARGSDSGSLNIHRGAAQRGRLRRYRRRTVTVAEMLGL
jgi:hypothetical protein